MGALLILAAVVIVWRVGYNVGRPDLDWLGYPEPTTTTTVPEVVPTDPVTCTLYEDGSVGCNASLVTADDYHIGGACIVPEWGCGD